MPEDIIALAGHGSVDVTNTGHAGSRQAHTTSMFNLRRHDIFSVKDLLQMATQISLMHADTDILTNFIEQL